MRIFILFLISLGLGIAQNSPSPLPLTATGNGVGQTNVFITTGPWSMNVQSDSLAIVYLYDATAGKPLYTVMNNQVINETGTFFLYVNVPSGAWSINVQSSPSSVTTPTTVTTPTASTNVAPTTPTPETTSPVTTPTAPTPTTTEPALPTEASSAPVTTDVMSLVSSADLKTWNTHFGFGISRYTRSATILNEAVCTSFTNIFEAQKAFFDAGGPETDIQNLDPDGDGYACTYNPVEAYAPPRTCPEGKVWMNGFYRRNGTFRNSGCANKN